MKSFSGEMAFLSNSHVIEGGVEYEAVSYPTVENAFQAAKTLDVEERRTFETVNAIQARRLGQKVEIRPQWDYLRVNVMKELVRAKFEDPELREKLLATGDEPLEETNKTHDNYWGACQCARCKGQLGLNWLGRILMSVRRELQEQEEVSAPAAMESAEPALA